MSTLTAYELARCYDTLGQLSSDANERGDYSEFHALEGVLGRAGGGVNALCPSCGNPPDRPGIVLTGPADGFGGPDGDPCEDIFHDAFRPGLPPSRLVALLKRLVRKALA